MVWITRPEDAETLFRTEGKFPIKLGLPTMTKHRQQRIEYLEAGGLLIDNGDPWWRIRSKAQQPLLKTKYMRNYVPAIGQIADEFVDRFVVCLITTRKFQFVRKTGDGVNGFSFLNNIAGSNSNYLYIFIF